MMVELNRGTARKLLDIVRVDHPSLAADLKIALQGGEIEHYDQVTFGPYRGVVVHVGCGEVAIVDCDNGLVHWQRPEDCIIMDPLPADAIQEYVDRWTAYCTEWGWP